MKAKYILEQDEELMLFIEREEDEKDKDFLSEFILSHYAKKGYKLSIGFGVIYGKCWQVHLTFTKQESIFKEIWLLIKRHYNLHPHKEEFLRKDFFADTIHPEYKDYVMPSIKYVKS